LSLVTAVLVVAATGRVDAETLYRSGFGTWDVTTTNWGTASGGPYTTAIWNNTTPDSAVLQGTAGTLTIASGQSINVASLTASVAGYTIAAAGTGSLNLMGSGLINFSVNGSTNLLTISAPITGTVGLTRTGTGSTTGILVLSGSNSYSGVTTFSGSANGIRITDANALGAAGAGNGTVIPAGFGTLRFELANNITVVDEEITVDAAGSNYGAFYSSSGSNTWTGQVSIGANGRVGAFTNAALVLPGKITGSRLYVRGDPTGVTIVSGSLNDYTGGTTVDSGILRLAGGDNRLVTTGTMAVNTAGTLDLAGFNQQFAGLTSNASTTRIGNSSTTADSVLTINLASGTNTFTGNLVDAIGGVGTRKLGLTKAGAGVLVLSGTGNTFSGNTRLDAGTVRIADASALQMSTVDIQSGSLSFAGLTSATLGGLKGTGSLSLSNTSSQAVAVTVGGNGESTSYAGNLSGLGSVVKTGSGTLTFTDSNAYAGTTSVLAGGLLVNGTNSGTGVYSVAAGAAMGGDGLIAGDLQFASGANFLFDASRTLAVASGKTMTFAGPFGIANIVGLDASTPLGTYTLVSGSVDFTNVINVGAANQVAIAGGGNTAYLQQGSLQLVIVPEPTAVALAVIGGCAALTAGRWRGRRRRPIVDPAGRNEFDFDMAAGGSKRP
jgi:autotransporter-associated beta strand protein